MAKTSLPILATNRQKSFFDTRTIARGILARKWDLAVVLLLLAAAVETRYNQLDVLQNTDEYASAAVAAYLQAEGQSAFSIPSQSTYANFLYLRFADWFGPYRLAPLRWFVLILCWVVAVLIYAQLSRVANRPVALLVSLFFVGYCLMYEGASANREWFAVVLVAIGLAVAARSASRPFGPERSALDGPRIAEHAAAGFQPGGETPCTVGASPSITPAASLPRVRHLPAWRWEVFASGGLLATGCLFKDQALPMAAVVPACFILRAWAESDWREKSLDLAAYLGGFLAVCLASLFPYAWQGTLDEHFEAMFAWWSRYGVESTISNTRSTREVVELLYGKWSRELPYRSLLVLPYGMTAIVLVRALGKIALPRRFGGWETLLDAPLAQINAWYFLFAVGAISAGLRFFPHYYLLILPAWCLLLGLALHGLTRPVRGWLATLAVCLLSYTVWLDVKPIMPMRSHAPRVAAGFVAFLIVFCLAYALAQSRRGGGQPFAWRRAIWLASITACLAAVAVSTAILLYPQPKTRYDGPALIIGDVVQQLSEPDDRLFVWGWLPEIYAYSRRVPASSYVTCHDIVNDIQPDLAACRWDDRKGAILLRDLEETRPRVIVDASAVSYAMSSREAYRIARYPALEGYLQRHYRVAAAWDLAEGNPKAGQIVFYQRRSAAETR